MSSASSLSSGTGLVSGLDYNSLITKILQADSAPITQAQRSEAKLDNQRAALQAINKAVTTLQSAAEGLSQNDSFLNIIASSQDTSFVQVGSDNTATPGSYSVRVRQLAQAQRLASQGITDMDKTSVVSTPGKFEMTVGTGSTISVDLTAGMTLQQLRDAINNASASSGDKVRASIVNDGSATNPYRLVLSATSSGTENAITIARNDSTINLSTPSIGTAAAATGNTFNGTVTASGTYTGSTGKNIVAQITSGGAVGTAKYKVSYDGGLTWTANDAFTTSTSDVDVTGSSAEGVNIKFAADGAAPKDFAVGDTFTVNTYVPELQKAQNAIVDVDGVTVSRPTNTIEDVLQGVTITAKKVSDTPTTISVANNNGGVQTKLKTFVDAYNSLVDLVKQQTTYNTETKTAAALFGDSGVTNIVSQMRSIITGTVQGLSAGKTISSVGVTMDRDGHLSIDSTKFTKAMSDDITAVKNLFIEAGKSSNSAIQLASSTTDTKTGTYVVKVTQVAEQAQLTGGRTLEASGLAADETLTIGHGEKALNVTLSAGMKLDQIVATLNDKFSAAELGLQASVDNGKLKIASVNYGSEEKITLFSNQAAAAAGQLGFGTATLTDSGVDVAGTINGYTATGTGQTLKASDATDGKGLKLTITANAPTTGTLTLTHGIGLTAFQYLSAVTDSSTGYFATRSQGIDSQYKIYEKRISDMNDRLSAEEDRLKKQFTALETKLSSLQSQSTSLQSSLSSLITSSSS